jgi:hypothetical protein
MLPRAILRGGAIGIALSFAGVLGAAAQSTEVNPSQDMAMQALSEVCAKDMPDVAKVQSAARRRWKAPQKLKGLDYWNVESPGEGAFSLTVGKQDAGQACTVSFAGNAAGAMPLIEQRFNLSRSQVRQGKRIWTLTLNGRPGMVFIEDHPASRFNLNVGIYLDNPVLVGGTQPAPGARARKHPTSATP